MFNFQSEGDFVHVICALLNRRTVFLDPVKLTSAYTLPPPKLCAPNKYPDLMNKEYMGAFGENSERGKFECEFCLHSREGEQIVPSEARNFVDQKKL